MRHHRYVSRRLYDANSNLNGVEHSLKEAMKNYELALDRSESNITARRCRLAIRQLKDVLKLVEVIDNE